MEIVSNGLLVKSNEFNTLPLFDQRIQEMRKRNCSSFVAGGILMISVDDVQLGSESIAERVLSEAGVWMRWKVLGWITTEAGVLM